MMYRLIVLTGPLTGQRITVDKAPMTIGRDPECAIVLPDDEVARRHAVLEHRDDGFLIRDLGSMNRILVNKREVRESRLKHGDMIEIGRTRFLIQALVQAEVGGATDEGARPKRQTGTLVAIVLVLGLGFGFRWWRESVRPAPVAAADQPVGVAEPEKRTTPPTNITTAKQTPAEPVNEDIRHMREQLADIRASMKDLAKERSPSQTPMTYPMHDALRQRTEKMFEEARNAAEAGHYAQADQMLANIQNLDPSVLEAYLQRAFLFEKRGMLKKAVEQWAEIERRSEDPQFQERAVAERIRVEKLEHLEAASSGRAIHIADVEPQRFQQSDEFDEMRVLKIGLKAELPAEKVDADAVRVDVTFLR